MYNATPRTAAAWRALFERVFIDAGVDIRLIEHGWPQPIDSLWSEPGLCCAFMCGWPFARSGIGMQPIAAPVPSPPRYQSLPRYCSDFLVREASGWTTLEEAFGHRFGWMAENSQSGFNAPRAHLARFTSPARRSLFSEVKGPLGTPAKTLEALRSGAVDLVALDGFYLDLLRHHAPGKLEGVRTVASTAWTPIPLLVAAPGIEREVVERLRQRLLTVHEAPSYKPLLEDVLLERFAVPEVKLYDSLEAAAAEAQRAGFVAIR
jgi:ABC-type phosphate/phosphonate transport system substrate-binding protein